jgi:hypothetical protein
MLAVAAGRTGSRDRRRARRTACIARAARAGRAGSCCAMADGAVRDACTNGGLPALPSGLVPVPVGDLVRLMPLTFRADQEALAVHDSAHHLPLSSSSRWTGRGHRDAGSYVHPVPLPRFAHLGRHRSPSPRSAHLSPPPQCDGVRPRGHPHRWPQVLHVRPACRPSSSRPAAAGPPPRWRPRRGPTSRGVASTGTSPAAETGPRCRPRSRRARSALQAGSTARRRTLRPVPTDPPPERFCDQCGEPADSGDHTVRAARTLEPPRFCPRAGGGWSSRCCRAAGRRGVWSTAYGRRGDAAPGPRDPSMIMKDSRRIARTSFRITLRQLERSAQATRPSGAARQ